MDGDLNAMCIRVRTEVYVLFAAAPPQHAQDVIAHWPKRKRQGLVEDFLIALPELGRSLCDAMDELLELKTLNHEPTAYPHQEVRVVDRRADQVQA